VYFVHFVVVVEFGGTGHLVGPSSPHTTGYIVVVVAVVEGQGGILP